MLYFGAEIEQLVSSMNMEIIKRIIHKIIVLLVALIVGQIGLIAVYLLPVNTIRDNVERGADILLLQGPTYQYAEGYRSAILDNETDAIMLGEAIYSSGNPVRDAVMVPRIDYANADSNVYALMGALNKDENPSISTYSRYWHGYLVFLKPFLILFDYSDYKIMNQALQFALLCLVIVLFVKRDLTRYLLAFIPAMILWNSATMGVSLQYSACYYISTIGVIVALLKKRWEIYQISNFFFAIGIAVAYFDFLTYPVATLGMPLITVVLAESKAKKISAFDGAKTVCYSTLNWGIGYALFWAMKWLIGTILTGTNIFEDAFGQIGSRISNQVDGETITRVGALYRIINVAFVKWPYVLMIVFVMIVVAVKSRELNWKEGFPVACAMAVIALIPFIWILLTANHSYIHPRLVYRNMGVVLYAALVAWVSFFTRKNKL